MKLSLKRSGQPVYAPNWHPNFRNTDLLPDLKVVRTTFFINATCIALASAVVMFTGYREYQAFSIRSSMSTARQHMAEVDAQNEAFLAANRQFMEGVRKFEEARGFVDARVSGTRLLIALSGSLPELMELSAVAYENDELSLRGTIRGDSEAASQLASAYLETLRAEAYIGPLFPDISLTTLQRDPSSQGMSFAILLKQPVKADGRKPARIAR